MKLSELLAVLISNKINVTLMDDNENKLITFDVSGYESIKDTITDLPVKRVKIKASNSIVIVLDTSVDPEPPTPDLDPDPEPDVDPDENIPYEEGNVPVDNPYSDADNTSDSNSISK